MSVVTLFRKEAFRWVLRTTWHAAVVAGLVLLLQLVLRKRISPEWRYRLWMLLVVRLLMFTTPQSALSIFNLVQGAPAKPLAVSAYVFGHSDPYYNVNSFNGAPSTNVYTGKIEVFSLPTPPGVIVRPVFKVNWFEVAFWGWLAGVCFFGTQLVWTNWRFRSRIATLQPVADEKVLQLLSECQAALKVTQPVRLIESEEVGTPGVYGFRQKWLLLPEGAFEQFSNQELRCIFLHELAHIKRGDLGENWLVAVLQVVHWFNPVLRFAFARMRADREMAADALALVHVAKGENVPYGETILKVVENLADRTVQPGLVGIAESKAGLTERIRAIAQFRPARPWKWAIILFVIAVPPVVLTDAKETIAPAVPPAVSERTDDASLSITGVAPDELENLHSVQVRLNSGDRNSQDLSNLLARDPNLKRIAVMSLAKLDRATTAIYGKIVNPEGRPASAQVALMIRKSRPQITGVYVDDSDLGLRGQPRLFNPAYGHSMNEPQRVPWNYCTTAGDGRFYLDDVQGSLFLLAANEKGFAKVSTNEFSAHMVVQLQPWGRIEGNIRHYDEMIANEPVSAGFARSDNTGWTQNTKFETKTDNQGRFSFDYVPSGRFTIFAFGISKMVTVESGKTTAVKIGGNGRTVVGRFKYSDPHVQIEWGSKSDSYMIFPEPERPSRPFKSGEEYFEWRKQPEFREWQWNRDILAYQVQCAADGSFRIDQVEPGNYVMAVGLHGSNSPYSGKFIGEYGGFDRAFEVPAIESSPRDPLNIGVIEILPPGKQAGP